LLSPKPGNRKGLLYFFSLSLEKSLLFLPQFSQKPVFPPSTSKTGKLSPLAFQTVHFISLERFRRRFCYSKQWFRYRDGGFVFSFLIILAEYLKNYSKITENYKI